MLPSTKHNVKVEQKGLKDTENCS